MKLIANPYSLDDCKLTFDKNGYGHAKVRMMKVGQLKYIDEKTGDPYFADVSLDELEKAKNTAVPIDITIRHPFDLLGPKDVQKNSHGTTLGKPNIEEIDGETWLTDGVILKTKEAIRVPESGQFGTSLGYWRDAILKDDQGNVDFKDIVPNHLAIGCFSPRAKGAELFSLDSSDSENGRIFETDTQQKPIKKEVRMKRTLNAVTGQGYSLDEARIDYADESDPVIEQMDIRQKTLVGQFDAELETQKKSFDDKTEDLTTKNGELTGENQALKAKNVELEKKLENTMSMDEAKDQIKEMSDIKTIAESNGITDDFDTPLAGKRLVVEKVYSTDDEYSDDEIVGAYKTIKKNPKDSKKMADSKKALADAKKDNKSMDSGNNISLSQISMAAVKRNKLIQKRKGA